MHTEVHTLLHNTEIYSVKKVCNENTRINFLLSLNTPLMLTDRAGKSLLCTPEILQSYLTSSKGKSTEEVPL